jgi:hypothetical protein
MAQEAEPRLKEWPLYCIGQSPRDSKRDLSLFTNPWGETGTKEKPFGATKAGPWGLANLVRAKAWTTAGSV